MKPIAALPVASFMGVASSRLGKDFQDCISFIRSLGIEINWVESLSSTIVPGFAIDRGVLQICEAEVLYPGDILHEAAHLAVVPESDRPTLSNTSIGQRPHYQAEEIMCIAWSYAACLHLKLDPDFVFHGDGYKGGGGYLAENFNDGRYIGVPMLQYAGMALESATGDQAVYPAMIKWVRD